MTFLTSSKLALVLTCFAQEEVQGLQKPLNHPREYKPQVKFQLYHQIKHILLILSVLFGIIGNPSEKIDDGLCLVRWPLSPKKGTQRWNIMDRSDIVDPTYRLKPSCMLAGLELVFMWKKSQCPGTIICTGQNEITIIYETCNIRNICICRKARRP